MKNFIGLISAVLVGLMIGPDSMTRWIIEKSVGFTDVGLGFQKVSGLMHI